MTDAVAGSITQVLGEIRAGDMRSAGLLWKRYFPRLRGLARRVLAGRELPLSAEDAVQTAFFQFLRTVEKGRIREGADREDLWRLLSVMTVRMARKQQLREQASKRGGRVRVQSEAELQHNLAADWRLDELPSNLPAPDCDLLFYELLEQLSPDLQTVAMLRLSGYRNEEIKQLVGCSLRSIERQLQLIRATWEDSTS